jgi:sterol desaturase/sphingolipid hydroxylase (fatty acid hydroxylase superfamily)
MKHEPFIRLGVFLGILLLMALWEILAPRRPLLTSKKGRWFANLSLVAIDTVTLRLILPVMATGVALMAEKEKIGLLNYLDGPIWMKVALGMIFLDLIIYLQHAMFHALPAFWRLHMMHHTDLDFDTTTGIRFHPLEIFLSMGIKMIAVLGLGVSILAVVIFEILLNATSLFNHGNVRLPARFDRGLRLFVVTPEMHRVHHSVIIRETNSNFGFNFPWWDWLFKTYRPQPAAGHEGMTIGLSHYREARELTLGFLLLLPFTGRPGKYAFNS